MRPFRGYHRCQERSSPCRRRRSLDLSGSTTPAASCSVHLHHRMFAETALSSTPPPPRTFLPGPSSDCRPGAVVTLAAAVAAALTCPGPRRLPPPGQLPRPETETVPPWPRRLRHPPAGHRRPTPASSHQDLPQPLRRLSHGSGRPLSLPPPQHDLSGSRRLPPPVLWTRARKSSMLHGPTTTHCRSRFTIIHRGYRPSEGGDVLWHGRPP